MEKEKQVLFQITPEQRFKNVLNALNALGYDYEIIFNGVKYERRTGWVYDANRPLT